MESIAPKIGCTAETLRKWVRRAERDKGLREGLTASDRDRLTALERENREVNTPPAKAGGFELRLKAGSIGHSADYRHSTVKSSSGSGGS